MHELSLAQGIYRIVDQALAGQGPIRVKRLVVEVGALAGVELHALRFALDALAPGTALEHAARDIETTPGQAWCLDCAMTVTIAERLADCPHCGGHRLMPNGGTELRVRELIVEDLPATRTAPSC